jgi:hypothetical protein
MSKNKSAKYKITDTDVDKKFIGKQVTVEKIKSKGGPGCNDRTPPKKQKSTRDLLIEFMGEQRAFNKQQLEFNKTIVNRLDRIVKVNNLKE